MSLDALDTAEVGEVAREVAAEAFWDWLDNAPEPTTHAPEEREKLFKEWTQWLHESTGRDFGEWLVRGLERRGYRVTRATAGRVSE